VASRGRHLAGRDPALTFGEIASAYDRHRPGYPHALYDDLLTLTSPVDRVLEVGAGTGKATVTLAQRGIPVVALEPDAAMAAVARRRCDGLPVEVRESRLEDWAGDVGSFGLVVAAQSWHWVNQTRGLAVARRALRRDGALAVWWNQAAEWSDRMRGVIDSVYARCAPDLTRSIVNRQVHDPDGGACAPLFEPLAVRSYRWIQRYDSASFAAMLQTHSDHRLLPPEQLGRLIEAVMSAVDEFAGGELAYPYRTDLHVFRRC